MILKMIQTLVVLSMVLTTTIGCGRDAIVASEAGAPSPLSAGPETRDRNQCPEGEVLKIEGCGAQREVCTTPAAYQLYLKQRHCLPDAL